MPIEGILFRQLRPVDAAVLILFLSDYYNERQNGILRIDTTEFLWFEGRLR